MSKILKKEFKNLKQMMEETVKNYKNNIAYKIKHKNGKEVTYEDITYEQYDKDIKALGTSFIKMGLKNKRIAVISKNRYEWIVTYLATVNGTGIIVPLDKGLPEQEILSLLERSKADVIVFEKEFAEIIKNIKETGKVELKDYICMDKIEGYKYIYDLIENGKKLLEEGNREFLDAKVNDNEMSVLLFTSGTTSTSKAVMLSHWNIVSNMCDMWICEKFYETDINIAFLPYHHTFGCTGQLLFNSFGITTVFCDGLRHIQENLKEYKVSLFVGVPLLIESMYKKIMIAIEKQGKTKTFEKGIKISNFLLKFGIDIRKKLFKEVLDNLGGNLRFIISGASALDPKVQKGFNDLGILTVQGYGLTESSPVIAAENDTHLRAGSIGIPMPSVEVKIDNPDENGIGELMAKGPNVMLGYYENEEETREVIKNGWLHTGDLAYIDKDGYIFITGRKKNVIVLKNGKNVFPEELENLINNLHYVEESMVYGKPKGDDVLISAKIVYNEEYIKEKYQNITQEELKEIIWKDIKEINKSLTNYKHIKNIIITNEPMIKTTTAKIKRHEEMKKIEQEEG